MVDFGVEREYIIRGLRYLSASGRLFVSKRESMYIIEPGYITIRVVFVCLEVVIGGFSSCLRFT